MIESEEFEFAIRALASFFGRNGYVRQFDSNRRDELGARVYKKGDEARFIAKSEIELETMQNLLLVAGFKAGKPFQKGRQFCLPVYGIAEVARLMNLMGPYLSKLPSRENSAKLGSHSERF